MNQVVSAGPGQGRAHRSLAERDHRPLQGPSRPPSGHECAEGGQSARRHHLVVPMEGRDGEEGRLSHRPLRRRLRLPAPVQAGLALDQPDRCHRDQGQRRDQRFRRRGLEPAGGPGHQERDPDGRSREYVRARPAVRPAQPGQGGQERRPDARPDRHDVQFPPAAASQSLHRHRPDRRAHGEVRLPEHRVHRLHRQAAVSSSRTTNGRSSSSCRRRTSTTRPRRCPSSPTSFSSATACAARSSKALRTPRAKTCTTSAAWKS